MATLRRFFVGLGVHDRNSQADRWCPTQNVQASFAFNKADLAGKCLAAALSRTEWSTGFAQVCGLGYQPIRSMSTDDDGGFAQLVRALDLWAVVVYPTALRATLSYRVGGWTKRAPAPLRREPTVFLGDARNVRATNAELRDQGQVPYVHIKEAAEWTFVMSELSSVL